MATLIGASTTILHGYHSSVAILEIVSLEILGQAYCKSSHVKNLLELKNLPPKILLQVSVFKGPTINWIHICIELHYWKTLHWNLKLIHETFVDIGAVIENKFELRMCEI